MTMTPVKNVCQWASRFRAGRPVASTDMMNTPMMVPQIVPMPPASDVPPMTAAAMAYSSNPCPWAGRTVV